LKLPGGWLKTTPQKTTELKAMMEMVGEAVKVLNSHRDSYDDFGRLLHETWQLKRGLTTQITNRQIDEIYEAARKAGALGGKLLGAGGGGFILLFARPEDHVKIKEKMGKLLYVPFQFHDLGSQIVYYAPEQNY